MRLLDLKPRRKLLICSNMSRMEENNTILAFYWLKIAKQSDEVKLLYIVKDKKHEEKISDNIHQRVGEFTEQCRGKNITCENTFRVNHRPGEGICEVVCQYNPHLVIMGSRGLNKFQRTVSQSVSDFVVHHSLAPVLVIPTAHTYKTIREGWERAANIAQASLLHSCK